MSEKSNVIISFSCNAEQASVIEKNYSKTNGKSRSKQIAEALVASAGSKS